MSNPHVQLENAEILEQAFIAMGVIQEGSAVADLQDVYHQYMQANHPDFTPNMPYDLNVLPQGKLRDAVIEVTQIGQEEESTEQVETDPSSAVTPTTPTDLGTASLDGAGDGDEEEEEDEDEEAEDEPTESPSEYTSDEEPTESPVDEDAEYAAIQAEEDLAAQEAQEQNTETSDDSDEEEEEEEEEEDLE